MLLSQPLRLTRKVAADQPSLKPPAPADGRPVVRIRLAEPQQNAGWCVDAQRSVKADQRDCTSTRVSAHRPGLAGGEWQLEPGSADFQFLIRFVSNHFSQTSGWLLDVAEDAQRWHSVIVRKDDDNVPAAEWMIEPQGGLDVSSGVSPTYRLRLAVGPSEAVGWFLNVDSKPCNRRTTDSVYLQVSPSDFATWIFEVQKAKAPRSLVLRQERLYEVVVCNLSGRPLILQGCQDVATRTRKAIAGSFLQLVPVVSALEGTEDHGALVEPTAQSDRLPNFSANRQAFLVGKEAYSRAPQIGFSLALTWLQAKFQHSGSCGDLLEFSVTYLTVEGIAFASADVDFENTVSGQSGSCWVLACCAWLRQGEASRYDEMDGWTSQDHPISVIASWTWCNSGEVATLFTDPESSGADGRPVSSH
ncbi:unnamed protein product [Symbiodinium sp. CCMP2592]|nr:unnamed protein product [Symbiodinium sp. CCMP2592]